MTLDDWCQSINSMLYQKQYWRFSLSFYYGYKFFIATKPENQGFFIDIFFFDMEIQRIFNKKSMLQHNYLIIT